METKANGTSLVFAGAWNPAILSPQWIAREVLRIEGGVPVRMEYPTFPGPPPRFSIQDILIVPSSEKLVLRADPHTRASLQVLENIALGILRALPHTPISAFGENFQFLETAPTPTMLHMFELNDELPSRINHRFDTSSITIISSLRFDDRILNLKRVLQNDDVLLDFNFHYDVSTAIEAADALQDTIVNNFDFALDMIRQAYSPEFFDGQQPEARS